MNHLPAVWWSVVVDVFYMAAYMDVLYGGKELPDAFSCVIYIQVQNHLLSVFLRVVLHFVFSTAIFHKRSF